MNDNDYLYGSWRNMHTRCYDEAYHSYHRYGGRGITACTEWQTYQGFKASCPPGWVRGLTLDRINNDGKYCPENCRWLSQAANKKSLLVDPVELLELYNSGYQQKELAKMFDTDQPHISRILAKGRKIVSAL